MCVWSVWSVPPRLLSSSMPSFQARVFCCVRALCNVALLYQPAKAARTDALPSLSSAPRPSSDPTRRPIPRLPFSTASFSSSSSSSSVSLHPMTGMSGFSSSSSKFALSGAERAALTSMQAIQQPPPDTVAHSSVFHSPATKRPVSSLQGSPPDSHPTLSPSTDSVVHSILDMAHGTHS